MATVSNADRTRRDDSASSGRIDLAVVVPAAQAGEEQACALLMVCFAPVVAASLFGKLRNEAEVEDLVQEVFIRAFTNLHQLRNPGGFVVWLQQIARNVLIDHQRRQARLPNVIPMTPESAHALSDSAPSPRRSAEQRQMRDQLIAALGRISEKERAVVYLSIFSELDSRDIAHRLGIRHGTARMRLSRGLKNLRRELTRTGWVNHAMEE